MTARRPKRRGSLPAAAVPNPRAVAAVKGVLDAVQGEFPEEIRELAPLARTAFAALLGIYDRPFSVDTGDGVAVTVRPADVWAIAVRGLGELTAQFAEPSTRERARAAFGKKLARRGKR